MNDIEINFERIMFNPFRLKADVKMAPIKSEDFAQRLIDEIRQDEIDAWHEEEFRVGLL